MHLLDTLPFQAPAQLPTAPFTPGQQAAGAAPRRAPAAGPPPRRPPAGLPRRGSRAPAPCESRLSARPQRRPRGARTAGPEPRPRRPGACMAGGTRASAPQAWGLHGRRAWRGLSSVPAARSPSLVGTVAELPRAARPGLGSRHLLVRPGGVRRARWAVHPLSGSEIPF